MDFDRIRPAFDKVRYKAEKLREQLKDVMIMVATVSGRLPTAKYRVLKYLRMGIIGLEHIANEDMLALATLRMKAERIREEIGVLAEVSRVRQRRKAEVWVAVETPSRKVVSQRWSG